MTATELTPPGPEAITWICRSSFCNETLDSPKGRGNGYCSGCAQRWWRAGMPDDGPPPPVDPHAPRPRASPRCAGEEGAERLERFAELRALDLTIAQCAAVMGITEAVAGHLNDAVRQAEREQACEGALEAVVDWPVPSPPREPVEHWSDASACYGHHDLFFAPEGRGAESPAEALVREAKAKSLCTRCPVRMKCLERALAAPEQHGVWGGLDEDERASQRRKAQRRAAARKERAA